MRRVLFLNMAGEIGGAEFSLLDLLASLRRAAQSIELHLLLAADGPLCGRAQNPYSRRAAVRPWTRAGRVSTGPLQ